MCQRCKQNTIMHVVAKCSDMYCGDHAEGENGSYVPSGLGIGSGDYIDFKLCLNCGQVQDTWPKQVPVREVEDAV